MNHPLIVSMMCALCLVFSAACDDDTSSAEPADNNAASAADTSSGASAADAAASDAETAWGTTCAEDGDCAAPTDLCVMQPGDTEGYCSIACPNLGADCTHADWTCNIIGTCDAPAATWCGPPSEVDEGGGFVVACE